MTTPARQVFDRAAVQAWCPTCEQMSMPADDGRCVWCLTPTGPRPLRRGKPKGKWGYLTDAQVRACHVLYVQGLSLRQVAAHILPRTRYTSTQSCAECLRGHFTRLGLPRRERIEATVAASTRHGLAPRKGGRAGYGAYCRNVLAGQEDQPRCAGVRMWYPRKGEQCQCRAMSGSEYCYGHDPAHAEERALHLASIRARIGIAAAAPR